MTFKPAQWPRKLRSQEWFGGSSRDNIYHRGWMKNQGFPHDLFDGRPVIGILNTWSELNPCNAHLNDLAQRVKNGIYEAGGFPVEVPVFSTSESAFRPTAMMFRNLAAMAVEEQMRGQPIDGWHERIEKLHQVIRQLQKPMQDVRRTTWFESHASEQRCCRLTAREQSN